jgi:hypothetical protein
MTEKDLDNLILDDRCLEISEVLRYRLNAERAARGNVTCIKRAIYYRRLPKVSNRKAYLANLSFHIMDDLDKETLERLSKHPSFRMELINDEPAWVWFEPLGTPRLKKWDYSLKDVAEEAHFDSN